MSAPILRLGHLYPRQMNIYADRGNIAVLRQRLGWRGLAIEVTEIEAGDAIDPARHDLYYLGGGQDRDQAQVAEDLLATKAGALRRAAGEGAVVLCVCGGYQLAGHGYTAVDGSRLPGIGLLDVDTVARPGRLIGDIVITTEVGPEPLELVGYENHAGRTRLGTDTRPLGRVVSGHGNNGEDRHEGAVAGRIVGTYLHGPLLPKNPAFADLLIGWALERRASRPVVLEPLGDDLERVAHRVAVARAGRER